MSFNILDNLDKLDIIKTYPTWIRAVCPVCNGKLTISRSYKNGAYACWSNQCHKKSGNLIYKKLHNPYNPFNRSSIFEVSRPKLSLVTVIKSKPLNPNIEPKDFLTCIKFIKPYMVREQNKDNSSMKLTTYFDYLDFKIVRLDYRDIDGNKKKYIYPVHLDIEGNEIQKLPTIFNHLPVYKLDYIQPCMVFVEGEKCATIGQYLGIACATFPMFVHTVQYLDRCISRLYSMGVTDVIYLRDNDSVGLSKATFISNMLSKNQIGNKIINVADLYDKVDVDKYDLYDLYKDKLIQKSTVLLFLDMCLND